MKATFFKTGALILLLCTLLGLGISATEPSEAGAQIEKYDLNNDRKISIADVAALLDYLATSCGHEEAALPDKAPTCEEPGSTGGSYCKHCNEIIEQPTIVPATGHTEVIDTAVEPTCTEAGLSEGSHCETCGKVLASQEAIAPTGKHIFSEWVTIKEATTTETGLMERVCSCGEKETQIIETIIIELAYALNADGQSYSVTGIGTWTDSNLTIPDTYKGLPVTRIENDAFHGCRNIISIDIPDSIAYIGSRAFKDCDNVTTLTIPDCVTIDYLAFGWCDNLNSVIIGKNVTFAGSYIFDYCISLTSVVIGDGTTSIGEYAFYECTDLTSVTIPGSVTTFENGSFSRCNDLTTITFEGTIAQWSAIKKGTSWNPTSATYTIYCTNGEISKDGTITCYQHNYNSIVTAPTATENGYTTYVCSNCNDTYTDDVVIPTDFIVTKDNREMVGYTGEKGEKLVIPAVFENEGVLYRVTKIDNEAFYQSDNLLSVIIPDSITSIGNWAFYGCDNLAHVTLGKKVNTIGTNAFFACYKLVDVCNKSSLSVDVLSKAGYPGYYAISISRYPQNYTWRNDDGYVFYEDGTLCYLLGYMGNDKTSLILPESCNGKNYEIYTNAFRYCTDLTSVTIADGTTGIGAHAFIGCTSLESIHIPSSVTSIGKYAFYDCTSLTSIVIPDSVTSIGDYAFYDCTSLTSIVIPDSVTSIGAYAFEDCWLTYIWCEATTKPAGWSSLWNKNCYATVRWGNSWEYVNGVPTLK